MKKNKTTKTKNTDTAWFWAIKTICKYKTNNGFVNQNVTPGKGFINAKIKKT
jgi:hypothetical protein